MKSTIWDPTDYLDSFLSISCYREMVIWRRIWVREIIPVRLIAKRLVYNDNILTALFSINGMPVTVYIY